MIHLPEFSSFFPPFGWQGNFGGKRNSGDCKRIFEQAVVEALGGLELDNCLSVCSSVG
jgi:hypothetical protein